MIVQVMLAAMLQAGPPMSEDDPLARALDVLARVDAARLAVDYKSESLEQVLSDLNARLSVPLRADWDALRRVGVHNDDRVSFRLPGSTGTTVLAGLAMTLGDELERPVFEAYAGQMLLTSSRAVEAMRLTGVYDVRDLLANEALIKRLHDSAPPIDAEDDDLHAHQPLADAKPAAGEAPGDANAKAGAPEENPPGAADGPSRPEVLQTAGEQLINLITDHVDPEAWMNFGGSRAKISDQNGVLIVTATPTTHRQLRQALRMLRAATSASMRVQAAIIDIPREQFASLSRQFDRRPYALAAAIESDAAAVMVWRSSDPASVDHPLAIESTHGNVTVRLVLRPACNASTGVCTVEVDAFTSQADDRRNLKTTVSFAGDERGVVIEIPSAKPDRTMRVLTLLIERG